MPSKLRDAMAALEQVEGGMIGGRVASADELDAVRASALEAAHADVRDAIEAGSAGARELRDAIPPWARPLLDSSLLANLEAVAEKHVKPTPERMVLLPFGAFDWAEDLASYECERPLSVAGVSVSLSLADVGPEDVAERLRKHAWLPRQLQEVVEAARRFAASEGLEMHNEGYADSDEGPITEAVFCARLTPTHLSLEADSAVIHFDDGDLFWGHYVTVSCDPAGRPIDLEIAG